MAPCSKQHPTRNHRDPLPHRRSEISLQQRTRRGDQGGKFATKLLPKLSDPRHSRQPAPYYTLAACEKQNLAKHFHPRGGNCITRRLESRSLGKLNHRFQNYASKISLGIKLRHISSFRTSAHFTAFTALTSLIQVNSRDTRNGPT